MEWTLEDVEIATLEWVDWFNNRRLHTGDIRSTEHETNRQLRGGPGRDRHGRHARAGPTGRLSSAVGELATTE